MTTTNLVHAHSSDPYFCGATGTRQFTVRDADITCPVCAPPNCDLCAQPMTLQECNGECDGDADLCMARQFACFCNSGNYVAV